MQRRTLVAFLERVVVAASAGALALERVVAADDAERVGVGVMPKAPAHRAPLCEFHRLRSHRAGSIAGPPCRISKCKCGGSSGSDIPTPPIKYPFGMLIPSRTSARFNDP